MGVSSEEKAGRGKSFQLTGPYAIVRTGSKQYTVAPGQSVEVEYLPGDVGQQIVLGEVLFLKSGPTAVSGNPIVAGAKVTARIIAQLVGPDRKKKVLIFKKKRRHGYTKKQGHRQTMTRVQIDEIVASA